MAVKLTIPDLGDFADVEVIEIVASPGDVVAVEDPLITLETDKATMDVPAEVAGTIVSIDVKVGDRVLETVGPGGLVGEMALISPDLRSATVTATADSQLAVIDQASFESLLNHVPEFTMHVMDVLADRLKSAFELIERT